MLNIKTRPLNYCPFCGTVRIRHRTRKAGYVCQNCGAHFQQAEKKVISIHGGTNPKFLKIASKGQGVKV